MAIMLKIRFDIKQGRESDFRENQKNLCAVMSSDRPGVICYHADYPGPGVSEWVEIYANNNVVKAHRENRKGKEPTAAVFGACDKVSCRCWGDPDVETKKTLAGIGTTYDETAEASFLLIPEPTALP